MKSVRDLEILNTLPCTKESFKNLGSFLSEHNLLDNRELWFA